MTRFLGALSLFALTLGAEPAKDNPSPDQIQQIIQKFASKETEFQKALQNYVYRQSIKFHELDPGDRVIGRWEEVWDVSLDAQGRRTEKVVRAPVEDLKNIIRTPEDMQDLRKVQPFVLTQEDLDKYQIDYMGRETVDEISCYVFSVKPKAMVKGLRYFQGQVWVDDQDLQIVKTYGRGVGILKKNEKQQFPKFETYREQIDGKYWFPTYTVSNDTLQFETGPQKIKMVVKYDNYKQFKAESTIKYGDEVKDEKPQEKKKQ
jgi:hypothetical protein